MTPTKARGRNPPLRHLTEIARTKSVAGFTADVFAHIRPMLHVLHKSGCDMKSSFAEGVYHLKFRFETEQKGAVPAVEKA